MSVGVALGCVAGDLCSAPAAPAAPDSGNASKEWAPAAIGDCAMVGRVDVKWALSLREAVVVWWW